MGWFSCKEEAFFLATVTPNDIQLDAYLGIVNGEAIIGANIFRDMFASIRDVVGGRAGGCVRPAAGGGAGGAGTRGCLGPRCLAKRRGLVQRNGRASGVLYRTLCVSHTSRAWRPTHDEQCRSQPAPHQRR